ncbi:Probable cadmium/zinc-transporting ATPase HMA1, chloroplastic [Galdieria sulphuraria]|uniref:Metal transporting P-type ATPase n=1 Tax=Galdieria sulphuraria TaxID=130081 RepID=M2XZB5_GALSU|nr:metal transporting P-type ATPase [Galdieria sulphuraria]EME28993.1 metal transporting P-type ATPase [Galdieria sulphuraria]GJD06932.1 Probable cadmium/zinc-transporting ATPase HMA1, chloroplastic [Galdieria sulphuraria]|eukprot:XP_005705513.1 metal transporting P-type ATPase [Galdieria sulphuraria]
MMGWNYVLFSVEEEMRCKSSLFIHCNTEVSPLSVKRNNLSVKSYGTSCSVSWSFPLRKRSRLLVTCWKALPHFYWKTTLVAHLQKDTCHHGPLHGFDFSSKSEEQRNPSQSLCLDESLLHCEGTLCGSSGNRNESFVKFLIYQLFPKNIADKLETFRISLESDIRLPLFAACIFIVALVGRYVFRVNKSFETLLVGTCFAICGLPALDDTVISLKARDINIDVLMTAAALASFFLGSIFEGTLLVLLYTSSHIAERKVQQFATKRLDSLRDHIPQTALCVGTRDKLYDSPREVSVSQVKPGDWILVRAGEIAPCDGIVKKGSAFVTREHFNGETLPSSVGEGSEVLSGSRTLDGSLVLEVSRMSSESTLQRILLLIAEAKKNRPPIQVWIDRWGSLYSRVVLFISFCIIVFLAPLSRLFGRSVITFWGSGGSLSRGLGFLVTTSPCALVIGAPVAYLSCLSVAASRGVFIKGGAKAIENVSSCSHFAFDKTGTLTMGKVHLVRIMTYSSYCCQPEIVWNVSQILHEYNSNISTRQYSCFSNSVCQHVGLEEALMLAASLERGTVHPFARALQAAAENAKLSLDIPSDYQAISGLGLSGTFRSTNAYRNPHDSKERQERKVWFGRLTYIMEYLSLEHSCLTWLESKLKEAGSRGESVAVLADSFGKIAVFCFVDQLRPETAEALSSLQRDEARITIVTGDSLAATNAIIEWLPSIENIQIVHSLSPKSKLDWISEWSLKSGLAMVGDGMNDAPALAAATTGIVLGLASATAVQAADIILVQPDLTNIVWLWKKAKCTKRIVTQNIIFALFCMIVASSASVVGTMPLWLAVIVHEGSTILVGLNGLRLLNDNFDKW